VRRWPREQDAAGTRHSADVQHGDWDAIMRIRKRPSVMGRVAKDCADWSNHRGSGTVRYVSHGRVCFLALPSCCRPTPTSKVRCGHAANAAPPASGGVPRATKKSPENCASPPWSSLAQYSDMSPCIRRMDMLGQVTSQRGLACTCHIEALALILERIMHAHHTPSEKLHRSARRDLRTSPIVHVRCVSSQPEICSYLFFDASIQSGLVGSRHPLPPIHTPRILRP
jgi:hypothetical protein